MKNNFLKQGLSVLGLSILVGACLCTNVFADDEKTEDTASLYYPDVEIYNAGKNGYSDTNSIKNKSDPHYGWNLGQFVITGFSKQTKDDEGNPLFLKTKGDQITLSYSLKSDISKLNDNEKLSIVGDKKGYDGKFGTKQTDFQKGALLVRYTDFENKKADPVIYTNFLTGESKEAENMTVQLNQEGDYEVALDYKVQDKTGLLPSNKYYRESFKFSVRNGNNMGFLFDAGTQSELKNCSFTKDGFYIDLAGSHYISVNVEREELDTSGTEPILDTRYNAPAQDGDSFTDEGIYTITFQNKYDQEPTTKKIYVGDDDLLKAFVTTGLPLRDIQRELDDGATVNDDGTIATSQTSGRGVTESTPAENNADEDQGAGAFLIALFVFIFLVFLAGMHVANKKNRQNREQPVQNQRRPGGYYQQNPPMQPGQSNQMNNNGWNNQRNQMPPRENPYFNNQVNRNEQNNQQYQMPPRENPYLSNQVNRNERNNQQNQMPPRENPYLSNQVNRNGQNNQQNQMPPRENPYLNQGKNTQDRRENGFDKKNK